MRPLLELAEIHLRTLYVHDEHGRIVSETVDEGRDAPRFVLVHTTEGVLARIRHDVTVDAPMQPVERIGGGPIFVVPDDVQPDPAVERTNVNGIDAFAIAVDGRWASFCWSSRNIGHAVQAGVETIEEFRGRGLAAKVVATWGYAMREAGITAIYSTAHENAASRTVARNAGLRFVGVDHNIF
jgi:hypothetical protein